MSTLIVGTVGSVIQAGGDLARATVIGRICSVHVKGVSDAPDRLRRLMSPRFGLFDLR